MFKIKKKFTLNIFRIIFYYILYYMLYYFIDMQYMFENLK